MPGIKAKPGNSAMRTATSAGHQSFKNLNKESIFPLLSGLPNQSSNFMTAAPNKNSFKKSNIFENIPFTGVRALSITFATFLNLPVSNIFSAFSLLLFSLASLVSSVLSFSSFS